MQALCRIAGKVTLMQRHLVSPVPHKPARELSRDDHVITDTALFRPLPNQLLGLADVVVVRRVNEVAAEAMKGVEQRKGIFVLAEMAGPGATETDAAECDG